MLFQLKNSLKNLKYKTKEIIIKISPNFLKNSNIDYLYYLILKFITNDFKNFNVLFGNYKNINFESFKSEKKEIIKNNNFFSNKNKVLSILGIYELQIQKLLIKLIIKHKLKYFTDIGAGYGFHFLGILKLNNIKKGFAFEINKKSYNDLTINCKKNFKSAKQLKIFKGFNKNSFLKAKLPPTNNLIYVDVDGEEFELIDDFFLKYFKKSIIVIEFHEHSIKNKNIIFQFKKKISSHHNVQIEKYKLCFEDKIYKNCLNFLKDKFHYNRYLITLFQRNNNLEYLVLTPKTI